MTAAHLTGKATQFVVSFGGNKPYASVYTAEYMFDKMYQGKKAEPVAAVSEMPDPNRHSNDYQFGRRKPGRCAWKKRPPMIKRMIPPIRDRWKMTMAGRGGVTAATPPLTAPSISLGNFEAVRNAGDKAVWDAPKSTMHVLYNNHIINVTVKTKGGAEAQEGTRPEPGRSADGENCRERIHESVITTSH